MFVYMHVTTVGKLFISTNDSIRLT